MKKILMSVVTVVCLAGFGALSFAEEMGKMKGEKKGEMMKGEMKAKPDEMKAKTDEMKMKQDEMMKGDMKLKKDEMKGGMKGEMGY